MKVTESMMAAAIDRLDNGAEPQLEEMVGLDPTGFAVLKDWLHTESADAVKRALAEGGGVIASGDRFWSGASWAFAHVLDLLMVTEQICREADNGER